MTDVSTVDCMSAGNGPLVILVHSSVSGARQWKKLMEQLAPRYRVSAPNLFGYGQTPAWSAGTNQTLADQADLILELLPQSLDNVCLVGHSFGASVAMKAASALGDRVKKLILIEPNLFFLLRDSGRIEALSELFRLRDLIQSAESEAEWCYAAEQFADFWGGSGTWAATHDQRRSVFAQSLRPTTFEWDAIMGESITLSDLVNSLPINTTVVWDPATVRPIREIVELLREASPWWFVELLDGGHMAPLTHPEMVNTVVEELLRT